jgi:CheY-like chemotaxis protein
VEIITAAAQKLKASQAKSGSNQLDIILDTTENISNTNNFMLMTINRFLDYAKSINGLKLVPNLDSVTVREAIAFSVKCIGHLQYNSKCDIKIDYNPQDVVKMRLCTDEQWLLENLLCLLANAVKYSDNNRAVSKSTVLLKISLINESSPLYQIMPVTTSAPAVCHSMPVHAGTLDSEDEQAAGKMQRAPRPLSFMNSLYSMYMYALQEGEENSSASSPSTGISNPHAPRSFLQAPPLDVASNENSRSMLHVFADDREARRWQDEKENKAFSFKASPRVVTRNGGAMARPNSSSSGKLLRFEVFDNGDVIARPEQLASIFHYKTASSRSTGGTGTAQHSLQCTEHAHDACCMCPLGLGLLSLSKRVEALGGTCGAYKRSDQSFGCVFWFAIPCQESESLETNNASHLASSSLLDSMHFLGNSRSTDDFNSLRSHSAKLSISRSLSTSLDDGSCRQLQDTERLVILIVDDSPVILKMSSMLLQCQGHVVHTANHGLEAVERIRERMRRGEKAYDAVLMDFEMPVMSGSEAAAEIRRLEAAQLEHEQQTTRQEDSSNSHWFLSSFSTDTAMLSDTAPVRKQLLLACRHTIIGFSANSDELQVQKNLSHGMDAFIRKPFTLQTFYETLERLRMPVA